LGISTALAYGVGSIGWSILMKNACFAPILVLLFAARFLTAAETDDAVAWGKENIAAGKYAEAEDLLRKALPTVKDNAEKLRTTTLTLIEVLRIRDRKS